VELRRQEKPPREQLERLSGKRHQKCRLDASLGWPRRPRTAETVARRGFPWPPSSQFRLPGRTVSPPRYASLERPSRSPCCRGQLFESSGERMFSWIANFRSVANGGVAPPPIEACSRTDSRS